MKIPVVRPSLNHKEQIYFGPPKFIAQLRLFLILEETYRTPTPGSSGTAMSFKTLGRDFEDRWSLDGLPDVGS